MKRTRSALSLKNIAQSIHRSMQLHAHRNQPDLKLNSYRSQSHLLIKQPEKRHEQTKISKDQKENRIFILEKQIVALERELDNSKSSIRNYSKELAEYQQTNSKIQQLEVKMANQRQIVAQISNQIGMMREEIASAMFNAEERVVEKQYYQQLVQAYERQYQSQSKKVLQIIRLEQASKSVEKEIQELNFQICYAQQNIQQWKEETDFDLNEHKVKNSLKIARVELIQLEDACDQHCAQYGLRKMRELCCSFFKHYAKKHGVKVEEARQGADIYICRNGLVQDFSEFVNQRIVYNKPACREIEKYLQTLAKMQAIYIANSSVSSKQVHDMQLQEIQTLQQQKEQKIVSLSQMKQKLKVLNLKLENSFSEQSLAVIEYLRERNQNVYDIREIKAKLKENKKEQNQRINHIKQAYRMAKHLENVIAQDPQTPIQQNNQKYINSLTGQLEMHQQRMAAMLKQMAKLNKEKDIIQTLISNAISKWRERDQNKVKLKQLYDQLKETKQAKSYAVVKNLGDTLKSEADKKKQDDFGLNDSIGLKNCSRKESMYSLEQSRSILSLSNPYKKIMEKEVSNYKPIIQDCQMIVSKNYNNYKQESKPFTICDLEESKVLQEVHQNKSSKKTDKMASYRERTSSKQNPAMLKNKSQTMTQTKYSVCSKPSGPSVLGKGKMSQSQRLSLSKLLISKFNR